MKKIARPHVPPRGWNSWDCFGTAVTESEVLANARFMAEHLLSYGWDTIVVDIQWYEPNARAGGYNANAEVVLDEFGRPLPAVNRFPSAADGRGFTSLADRVHALGLKFGLHIMRGIPRVAVARRSPVLGTRVTAADIADTSDWCDWNGDNWGIDHDHPDAAAYYRSLAELFAGWGVDFVKADDMLWPYHARDIEGMSAAFAETGRDIVLSLSPGGRLSTAHAAHLAANATMWRVSFDLWDNWPDVEDQFQRMARWAPHAQPGAWPDADMLPLGHIGVRAERGEDRMSLLTEAEQRTVMTLWGVSRSPLFVGGDLPTSPASTIALLTNREVLDVNASARNSAEVLREPEFVVWTADLDDERVVAVFATADGPLSLRLPLSSVGLGSLVRGHEAWSGADAVVEGGSLVLDLPRHGAALYLLRG
jgi:alpha-galactosidase